VLDAAVGEDESTIWQVAAHLDVAGVTPRDKEDGRGVLEIAELCHIINTLQDPSSLLVVVGCWLVVGWLLDVVGSCWLLG